MVKNITDKKKEKEIEQEIGELWKKDLAEIKKHPLVRIGLKEEILMKKMYTLGYYRAKNE